jgi:enamine deaminase RidA (YjgF/YER057c/UK114 family)
MPSNRQLISSGSQYEKAYSYSRAVAIDGAIAISGTTGYDYINDRLADGAADQTRQIFRNARAALAQAGADLANVTRVRIYIANTTDYDAILGVFAEAFAGINPACTAIQAGLFDPDILVEMDMDAVVR